MNTALALDPVPTLRVAAGEAVSRAGDVPANVASAMTLLEQAAAAGARVLVLPELFLSGYSPHTLREEPDRCDVTVTDPRLGPLREACARTGTALVAGASVRGSGGVRTLSLLVFDADGEVSVPYHKQHLWDQERAIFTAGSRGGAVVVDGWRLGLSICYDGCFPEHAMQAAETGALAYLAPSAYVLGSEHRRDLYYAARALDNGMYCVFAGLTGPCGELEFSGGTTVYSPEGQPITRAAGPGVVYADLDVAEVTRVRAMNPIAEDRARCAGPGCVIPLEGREPRDV